MFARISEEDLEVSCYDFKPPASFGNDIICGDLRASIRRFCAFKFVGWCFSFEVNPHRLLHTQRLVPPKCVCYRVQASKGQRNELKLCQSKPLLSSCNALKNKPCRLHYRNKFREKVPFRSVLYVFFTDLPQLQVQRRATLSLGELFISFNCQDWTTW